eukprot:COSAG02_NODE_8058_length_2728_cov_3.738684_2_plen_740_part_00
MLFRLQTACWSNHDIVCSSADPCPPYSIDAARDRLCRFCSAGKVTPTSLSGDPIPGFGPWGADQAAACGECPAGKSRSETQQVFTCIDCPIGKFSVGGQSECSTCDNHQVPNRFGAGATSCVVCGSGEGPSGDGTTCQACGAGMFSSAGVCDRCTGDTVPNLDVAATACISCPSGKGPTQSYHRCEECGEGLVSTNGVCTHCLGDEVPNSRGAATACIKCRDPTQTGVNGVCVCRDGYYNASDRLLECVDSDVGFELTSKATSQCQRCPVCGVCDQKNITYPLVTPGFTELPPTVTAMWTFDIQEVRLAFRCDLKKGRQGDNEACRPRFPGETSGYREHNMSSACVLGRTGYLCLSCVEGYHTVQRRCIPCPPGVVNSPTLLTIGAMIVLAACAYWWAQWWTRWQINHHDVSTGHRDDLGARLASEHSFANPMVANVDRNMLESGLINRTIDDATFTIASEQLWKRLRVLARATFQPLRMVISWVQITSQIGGVLHIRYPPQFESAIDALRFLEDTFSVIFDSECTGFDGFLAQWKLKVIVLPCSAALLVAGAYAFLHSENGAPHATQQAKSYGFGFVFLLYPSICNTAFAAFECRELVKGQEPRILEADDRLLCGSVEMQIVQSLSMAVIAVVALGVPLLFTLLLVQHARAYKSTRPELNAAVAARLAVEFKVDANIADYIVRDVTAMGQSFSFLLDAYTFECYYWETLDLLRKLLLVGLVLLVRRGSVAQNVKLSRR